MLTNLFQRPDGVKYPHRHIVRKLPLLGAIVAIVFGAIIILLVICWPFKRESVLRDLEQVSRSDVRIGGYREIYFPDAGYVASDLVFTRDRSSKDPPLVTIREITVRTSWFSLLSFTHRIKDMQLEGVHVYIPAHVPPAKREAQAGIATTVSDLTADNALLEIAPRRPGGSTTRFEFPQLAIHHLKRGDPLHFRATVHSETLPGDIHASGSFGPLQTRKTGRTPASGTFTIPSASLGQYHTIAGTLSATGRFNGTLNHMQVSGDTDMPNFEVISSHHPVAMRVNYRAIVDGMNGDVDLSSAAVHFLGTNLGVHGTIRGEAAKTVGLDFTSGPARIQDLLRLFVSAGQPPMNGPITFRARVVLPPGKRKFVRRVELAGNFDIQNAYFSNALTQAKVDQLSARARGEKPKHNEPARRVSSEFAGHVFLRNGVATFSNASFSVAGATARGEGTFDVITEAINLQGRVAMQASLSRAAGGIKSVLMKPIDPFYKKNGAGAVLPFEMTGTYAHPSFKVSLTGKK